MPNYRNVAIIVAIITLVIGGIVLAIPQPKTLEETIVAQATEVPTTEVVQEESDLVMTVVEVSNPFENDGSYSVSYSIQGDPTSVGAMSSKTSYTVNDGVSEITLPSADQFEQVGINAANMGDNGTIILVHEYTFLGDSLITWDNGSSIEDTNSWEPHPNVIPVTRGQNVTVTYTSLDGGSTWIGKVIT